MKGAFQRAGREASLMAVSVIGPLLLGVGSSPSNDSPRGGGEE